MVLDFDGTLAPIVRNPHVARLAPAVRQTLKRLAAHPRVGLAVLSGRSLSDVKRRVGRVSRGSSTVDVMGWRSKAPVSESGTPWPRRSGLGS
ncbi:MAG: trehalose-phosphatase [Candidatus Rokuibacteriota bacterium]